MIRDTGREILDRTEQKDVWTVFIRQGTYLLFIMHRKDEKFMSVVFPSRFTDESLIRRIDTALKDLKVTLDSAIPISLIINELVSNSIKHAFPKGTHGEITIAGRREADTLVLSIRDTGIGIPKDFDWMRSTQSLGLRLVAGLVGQVDGTIELDRTTGTAFNIVVKEKL
jgi:two-component sensor histidine kinase